MLGSKLKLTFLLLLAFIFFVKAQEVIDFQLGYFIEKLDLEPGKKNFYKLIVNDNYRPGLDIIIKAIPLIDESDPDIYISKTVKNPSPENGSDIKCASFGRDTCTIHHSLINEGDFFYFSIGCPYSKCSIQMLLLTSDEFKLDDGAVHQTLMTENEAKIFKFYIPNDIQDQGHITVKASSISGFAHDFSLSVSTDVDKDHELPSSSLGNKKSISAWKKGQVIRLNKENFPKNQWCKGCELKILLDVRDAGYYHIIVQTSDAVPKVHNNDQIDDIVGFDQIQCYQYYIKSEQADFQITLTTYTGRVELRFNPGTLPTKWDDFLGKPDEDQEIIVDIRPWQRSRRYQQAKGLYFFCVRGEITSTYTIKAKEFDQDWTNSIIEDGYSEMFGSFPNSLHTHLYRVPRLEYAGEDIKIEFDLMVKRGPEPTMAVAFCAINSTTECKKQATVESINNPSSNFKKAQSNGQILKLVIDHDEDQCQKLFNGTNCYYVVAVHNQNDHWVRYKLQASHNQNNHILLQERTPKLDSVEMGNYKYYKFTILEQENLGISNVTFEINPLHGDSDLLASRNITFPNKDNALKRSSRVGSLVDHVTFSKGLDGENLAGTYYIGIYGYTYTTYSIHVIVNRTGHDEESSAYSQSILLYQGIPITKTLHSSSSRTYSYFTVSIDDQEDHSILIQVQELDPKIRTLVKYGAVPAYNDYDFKLDGTGQIEIFSYDEKYHRNGSYFITSMPHPNLLDLLFDNTFSFSIMWRLEDAIPHLNSQGLQQVVTKPLQYSYLKHYILDNTQDVRLYLITKGHQDIFVSGHPSKQYPSSEEHDFTTRFQRGENFGRGKALIVPMNLLKEINPSCKDLGYAEDSPCAIYISIYCSDLNGCNAQIELEYDTKQAKRLYSGQQKHTLMSNDSYSTYYIPVKKQNITDVFGVLQPLVGDVYMTSRVQRMSDQNLILFKDYVGKHRLNSQIIHVTPEQIQQCFNAPNANPDVDSQDDECQVFFYILPTADNTEQNIIFNFGVHKSIIEVHDRQPIIGKVEIAQYKYFLYQETCENCSMIISLSSHSSEAVKLIVKKGTSQPSLGDHDISSLESGSLLTVNLQDPFFKKNNIKSMEGSYVIGIFGLYNTTFQLSVTSEYEPVVTITDRAPLSHSQEMNQTIYFQYYQWKQHDVEITLNVNQGFADLFVSTYNPKYQDFIARMPFDKINSEWTLENINPANSFTGKDILVLQGDNNYCFDCYYLIGVHTRYSSAAYSLEVKSIDAEKEYTNLLRVGDNKIVKIDGKKQQKIYQFLLESQDPASLTFNIISGDAKFYLGFTEDAFSAFYTQNTAQSIDVKLVSPNFEIYPEKNYYLIIESKEVNTELQITLTQEFSVINLYDGTPTNVFFRDSNDTMKSLKYMIPKGNTTIIITAKSKTPQFYPSFYYTLQSSDKVTWFGGRNKMEQVMWDKDQYILQTTIDFENLQSTHILGMIFLYHMDDLNGTVQKTSNLSGTITVTLSQSMQIKLAEGEEYFGQLKSNIYEFLSFALYPPQKLVTTQITFSNCLGSSKVALVTVNKTQMEVNKRDNNYSVPMTTFENVEFEKVNGVQIAHLKNVPGNSYLIVTPHTIENFNESMKSKIGAEFTIKVDYIDSFRKVIKDEYIPFNGGHINFQPQATKRGDIQFSWNSLYLLTAAQESKQLNGIRYKLVYTKNPDVNLDQVCAIQRRSDVNSIILNGLDLYQATATVEPNTEFSFNVIAIVENKQLAIPYKPITINMPAREAHGGRMLLTVVGCIFMIFLFIALYFFLKNRQLQAKLRFELRDVNGGDLGTQTYRRVNEEKFSAVDNE
ncbi:UNKNOWN [Stylonychia lemnae]|uniref:Transmembrane protein n=1 Tax=Stylonychia lemnae TaxID=5949 RepID=A0A077ZNV7_STYLE|nr:UNKNOWN [Stylonychia lemnae]|eukprot:CDW71154.1 UNKNOWN [Stylonychia lemnae]